MRPWRGGDGGDIRQVRVCMWSGGREGWMEEEREERMRGGERETLCMKIPLSGDTISRFFEILKTVVDYLRRQSDKSVTTSVS